MRISKLIFTVALSLTYAGFAYAGDEQQRARQDRQRRLPPEGDYSPDDRYAEPPPGGEGMEGGGGGATIYGGGGEVYGGGPGGVYGGGGCAYAGGGCPPRPVQIPCRIEPVGPNRAYVQIWAQGYPNPVSPVFVNNPEAIQYNLNVVRSRTPGLCAPPTPPPPPPVPVVYGNPAPIPVNPLPQQQMYYGPPHVNGGVSATTPTAAGKLLRPPPFR